MKNYYVKITSGGAVGQTYTIYYDYLSDGKIADRVSTGTPAVGVTYADLIAGSGVGVYVPDNFTNIIIENDTCKSVVTKSTYTDDLTVPPTPTLTRSVYPGTHVLHWGGVYDLQTGTWYYNIYRKIGTGAYSIIDTKQHYDGVSYDQGHGTTAGLSYSYYITAVDYASNESLDSNIVTSVGV